MKIKAIGVFDNKGVEVDNARQTTFVGFKLDELILNAKIKSRKDFVKLYDFLEHSKECFGK